MPHYIEFTTQHHEPIYGNPIHTGNKPARFRTVEGICVDGEPLHFVDETIPERMHRYLHESSRLRWRGISNDCVAFAAIMESIKLRDSHHNPFVDFDETQLADDETTVPIVLAKKFHDTPIFPLHTVIPAQTLDGSYGTIHKLGDRGPVCLSSLKDAKAIMGCNLAIPVTGQERLST